MNGLAFIGAVFLTAVWGGVFWRGRCRRNGSMDQFCWIALGLAVGSFGQTLLFGARTWLTAVKGVEPEMAAHPGALGVAIGLTATVIGKGILMWAYDETHSSRAWFWFIALSLLWMAVVPVLELVA